MDRFLKVLNDYSCYEENDTDNIKHLYHYTSSVAAVRDIENGIFWATKMSEFRKPGGDESEGVISLRQLRSIIKAFEEQNLLPKSILNRIYTEISTDTDIERKIRDHNTYVISFCLNGNSDYMWANYAKRNGYKIELDKEIFLKSAMISTPNGTRDSAALRHAPIIYDSKKQREIIADYIKRQNEVWNSGYKYEYPEDYYVELLIRHLMYVGNYYKEDTDYPNEEEYRVLINSSSRKDCTKSVPIEIAGYGKTKTHIVVSFDKSAVLSVERAK